MNMGLYPRPNPKSKNYLEQVRLKRLHHDLVCLFGAIKKVRQRILKRESFAADLASATGKRRAALLAGTYQNRRSMGRECAKYVAAWRGLSPEQRVVQKIKKEEKRLQKIQDREARHQRALIRAKEDNRRRALAAYHAGAKLRQVSGGFYWESKKARRRSLFAAARRVFLPRRESPQKLAAAARSVARRWKRRGNAHLNKILRGRLENIVKKTKIHCMSVSKMARDLVGCELWELRAHLERQFKPGMTWENHSFTGWHVDHKRPLAKFDLSIPEQAAQAFHFSNLQPLWAAENLSKGTKMI